MLVNKCRYPGCNETVTETYCPLHSRIIEKRKAEIKRNSPAPFLGCNNPNKKLYNSWKWRKLRAEWLSINNVCVFCGATTDLTVDHIERPKGNEQMFFDRYNLRTLCRACHYRHTGYENAKGKRK